jgi:acyl-CoA synthetase (NDP forming)
MASGALRGGHRRSVYLVNQRGGDVLGERAYRGLHELPETPELVVLAVPMSGFDQAVDASLGLGTKAILAVNSGFAELGGDGAVHQQKLVCRIRAAGAALIGPNCMGVVDTRTDLDVAWTAAGALSVGSVGVISQSGNVGFDISKQVCEIGLGISRFVSLGNQADVGVTDVVRSLAGHAETRILAVYCEDFRDGRAFLRASQEALRLGKHLVLLTPGGNESTARAAQSHTGALTTDDAVIEAVCRASGAIRVLTPAELVDVVQVLLKAPRPRGRRMAIVSDGGGDAVIATSVVTRAGFAVDAFSDGLRTRLRAATSDDAGIGNPVDLASAGLDPTTVHRVVNVLAESHEVDAIVMTGGFGSLELVDQDLGQRELEAAKAVVEVIAEASLPLIVQTAAPTANANIALRDGGVPVFRHIERAVDAFRRVVEAAEYPLAPIDHRERSAKSPAFEVYFAARRLLMTAGIAFPAAKGADTLEEALDAAHSVGYPVALKAVSLLHKSDAGGVALDLRDPEALSRAFGRMQSAITDAYYSVEAMVSEPEGVELVIGCRRDPRFGPVLLVGLGGIHTEILRDFKLLVAPASPAAVKQALRSLRGAMLLEGPRGTRPVDLDAVCESAAVISELAAGHPSIAEIEVNPLLAHPRGAIALDARIVRDVAARSGDAA